MLDTAPLDAAAERLADRLRRLPESRLRRGPAAAGLALARDLSHRAQRLEDPRSDPRTIPDAGPFVVADQLVVAVHDLTEALRAHGTRAELAAALEAVTATSA